MKLRWLVLFAAAVVSSGLLVDPATTIACIATTTLVCLSSAVILTARTSSFGHGDNSANSAGGPHGGASLFSSNDDDDGFFHQFYADSDEEYDDTEWAKQCAMRAQNSHNSINNATSTSGAQQRSSTTSGRFGGVSSVKRDGGLQQRSKSDPNRSLPTARGGGGGGGKGTKGQIEDPVSNGSLVLPPAHHLSPLQQSSPAFNTAAGSANANPSVGKDGLVAGLSAMAAAIRAGKPVHEIPSKPTPPHLPVAETAHWVGTVGRWLTTVAVGPDGNGSAAALAITDAVRAVAASAREAAERTELVRKMKVKQLDFDVAPESLPTIDGQISAAYVVPDTSASAAAAARSRSQQHQPQRENVSSSATPAGQIETQGGQGLAGRSERIGRSVSTLPELTGDSSGPNGQSSDAGQVKSGSHALPRALCLTVPVRWEIRVAVDMHCEVPLLQFLAQKQKQKEKEWLAANANTQNSNQNQTATGGVGGIGSVTSSPAAGGSPHLAASASAHATAGGGGKHGSVPHQRSDKSSHPSHLSPESLVGTPVAPHSAVSRHQLQHGAGVGGGGGGYRASSSVGGNTAGSGAENSNAGGGGGRPLSPSKQQSNTSFGPGSHHGAASTSGVGGGPSSSAASTPLAPAPTQPSDHRRHTSIGHASYHGRPLPPQQQPQQSTSGHQNQNPNHLTQNQTQPAPQSVPRPMQIPGGLLQLRVQAAVSRLAIRATARVLFLPSGAIEVSFAELPPFVVELAIEIGGSGGQAGVARTTMHCGPKVKELIYLHAAKGLRRITAPFALAGDITTATSPAGPDQVASSRTPQAQDLDPSPHLQAALSGAISTPASPHRSSPGLATAAVARSPMHEAQTHGYGNRRFDANANTRRVDEGASRKEVEAEMNRSDSAKKLSWSVRQATPCVPFTHPQFLQDAALSLPSVFPAVASATRGPFPRSISALKPQPQTRSDQHQTGPTKRLLPPGEEWEASAASQQETAPLAKDVQHAAPTGRDDSNLLDSVADGARQGEMPREAVNSGGGQATQAPLPQAASAGGGYRGGARQHRASPW